MTTPTSQRRQRYSSAAETMQRESRLSKRAWRGFEQACRLYYGRTKGATIFEWIRRGEHDYAFASERLLGIRPLDWHVGAWDALTDHRYVPVRASNAGGKTTGYAITDMLAGFYRSFATPEWGSREYRILHIAPEEAQALETQRKINAILEGTASEQMFKIPGGFAHRPCLLTPFFEEAKPDGIHQGFSILDGSATITFRPTTYKAKGSDGTDPALITWDELRHEKNFDYVLNAIIMPRFLRVPFGRLLLYFTPLGASVELLAAYARGVSGLPDDVDWFSIALEDLKKANPSVSDETIARANRNISKRYLPMVMSGKPIQPDGAKFSQESVDASFIGTTEADWLDDVVGIRRRVMERCATCQRVKRGEDIRHTVGGEKKHPLIGFFDPASSAAGADSIAATAWDLQPPTYPMRWAEVVYIEELAPGTKIQRSAAHVAIMSIVIHGPVGYDQNSALGHNITDELSDFPDADEIIDGPEGTKHVEKALRDALRAIRNELMDEPDIVPVEHNKRSEKDVDLDYLAGLLDLEVLGIPFHLATKSQLTNYVRKDTGIAQDFVLVQAGAAFLAKYEMPDMFAERTKRDKGGRRKASVGAPEETYAGLAPLDDVYFELPSGIGDALGTVDAYGAQRGDG